MVKYVVKLLLLWESIEEKDSYNDQFIWLIPFYALLGRNVVILVRIEHQNDRCQYKDCIFASVFYLSMEIVVLL